MRFTGQVAADGKSIKPDAPLVYLQALAKLKGKRVEIEIYREYSKRSDPQNRRYYKVIVPVCREVLNRKLRERGCPIQLTKEQTDRKLEEWFSDFDDSPLGPVLKHCKDMDVARFSRFMDEIEAHFTTEEGAVFPSERDVEEAML